MKDKIILFIIGVLVGAIISTGAFFVYTKATTTCNNNSQMGMPGGNPPSMPNGQNGQPPEMLNGNNSQNNTQSNSQSSNN
jgi:hypothetical protein